MSSALAQTDPGALLLAVLENVGLAVVVLDEQGKIAFANKTALTMWGEHSIVPGASFAEWRSVYRVQYRDGRDIPAENSAVMRTLTGDNTAPRDFRVILPDGSVRWMHAISERFSVFSITGVLLILEDETEQVLLQRAMQQFEQIQSLGHLTRGMIHDLNNMFAVVSENLSLTLAEDIPQPARDRLQHIEVAFKKGTELMKKLGQFSRARDLPPEHFEINHAVNTGLELARPLLFGSQIRVKLALDPNLPTVKGDAGEIEQALVNLILNAVDAMPNGGEISLSTELVKRDGPGKSGERPGRFILLRVADTGVGIPEDIQPRIFEPFFTTKAEKRGTGLGLPSVYGIVEHHGGEIKVHSVPGQGTSFTIYLPVSERSP